jgi:hypothetical protein
MPSVLTVSYRARDEVRRHWAVFLGLTIGLAIWCGVDVARRAIVDPQRPALHMTDFTVYTEAGAAFFDGREPYDVTNIRGWKYLYPPLFALLVAPLADLPTEWQATVWFTISALMAFGCYFECRRLVDAFARGSDAPHAARAGIDLPSRDQRVDVPGWLFVTSLLAALFPAFNCLQRGQMGLALAYPLLVGFRLIWLGETRLAWAAGGIVLALPIALKFTPALPAACALAMLAATAFAKRKIESTYPIQNRKSKIQYSPSRSTIANLTSPSLGLIAGCLVFFLLLPAGLVGWDANLRHLHTWYVRVASRVDDVRADDFGGHVASFRNQSLYNAVYRCGNWAAHQFLGGPDDIHMDVTGAAMPMDAPAVSQVLTAIRIAAVMVLAVVVVSAGRSADPLLQGAAFGMAGVATLVVSPVSRGHYFVLWLPAVVFVPLWFRTIGRPRTALVLSAIPAVLTLAHYALLQYAGRVGLLGLGTAGWYFAACIGIWKNRTAQTAIDAARTESHVVAERTARAA